ncbi:4Fe-4S cluster-binding domain-containing protein [Streptomyces caelestis]|uniref:4Fe-4S cluster-binding domain-containing protein n=1 Tax=Streptomyces TaxID=1883 RepID=UPI001F308DEC|nr:4Fe-4S cluster-binding domain-containing protein [Streptomyces sp. XY152]
MSKRRPSRARAPTAGTPPCSSFIRLSRCNPTCAKCDTRYTWDWSRFDPREESTKRSVADLVARAASSPVEPVVITGGEPLIQQSRLVPLVRESPADGVRFNASPELADFGVDEAKSIMLAVPEAFAASGRAAFKCVASTVADLDRVAELAGAPASP